MDYKVLNHHTILNGFVGLIFMGPKLHHDEDHVILLTVWYQVGVGGVVTHVGLACLPYAKRISRNKLNATELNTGYFDKSLQWFYWPRVVKEIFTMYLQSWKSTKSKRDEVDISSVTPEALVRGLQRKVFGRS